MPKLIDSSMEQIDILGSKGAFNFSAVKIDNLGATEYTLVTIAVDNTGSVSPFAKELVDTLKSAIEACKKSPRAENLLLRVISFNTDIDEVHGFKLLNAVDLNAYSVNPNGNTALFDAVYSSLGATLTYAKKLTDQDFGVNGICFIITDGEDNASSMTPDAIYQLQKKAKIGEEIESMITVLVGINAGACSVALDRFKSEANLTQFVDVGEVTSQRLAKLAAFVSKSISSQSQALGSGGASQPLVF